MTPLLYLFAIMFILLFTALITTIVHYLMAGLFHLADLLLDPIFYPKKKKNKRDGFEFLSN